MQNLEPFDDGINQNLWKDEDGNIYVGRPGQTAAEILDELDASRTEPLPVVTILPAVTLWGRLTEAEAEQVNAAMATQPVRTQRIFTTANTFRSDHELWPPLEQIANDLFGAARAAELLAP